MKDEFTSDNVANDTAFVLELARLEGKLPTGISETRVSDQKKFQSHKFEYQAFVHAHALATTNCVPHGGDSGHGYETHVLLSFESGDFSVQVSDKNTPDNEAFVSCRDPEIIIKAGGCDEAMALARMLELAAVAIRTQMAKNSQRAKEKALVDA